MISYSKIGENRHEVIYLYDFRWPLWCHIAYYISEIFYVPFTISYKLVPYFNWSHPNVFSLKYSKSKFSQNTTNLLSIKMTTCFDS